MAGCRYHGAHRITHLDTHMELVQHRSTVVRRLAFWCAALVLVITSLSAFIRLSQAGLGCAPWPQCFGSALQAAQQGVATPVGDSTAVQAARLAHRVIATTALAGVLTLVAVCLVGRPRLWRSGLLAMAALLLALGLAVLGASTRGSRLPVVAIGNLLGGMLMFALCWRLAAPTRTTENQRAHTARSVLAGVVSAVLLMQIGLGALTSASFAGQSCSGLFDCLRLAHAAHWPWAMLIPWREPVWDAQILPIHAAAAVTQFVHRFGAGVVLMLTLALVRSSLRSGGARAGWLLLALLGMQLALGVLLVGTGLALPVALLHNLLAAAMLALVVRLI